MNPRQPYNPFSRDEYPALTDAIRGVVNGQPREVEEAVTPAQRKVFNAERERMMRALNNPNKKLSPTEREAVLARGQRNAAAEVRKDAVSPTGVKSPVHAQAKAYHEYARKESKKMDAIAKRKSVKEAASPTEGKKPSNPFNPTLGDLLKSKQQDKKADAKTKGVKEDFQTPERAREMSALKKKLKHEADRDSAAAWRAGEMGTADEADAAHNKASDSAFRQMQAHMRDAKEREDKTKVYGKGGKVVASGVKLKSKSGGKVVREDFQTPAREREMLGKMKRAEARTDAEGKRYMRATGSAFATSKTKTEREKKIGKASKRYNTALSAQDKTYATQRKEEMSRRLYGKGGKLVKRAVKESQELSERIIDEVDFFQASKNWVKGKGFKTNREVSYDRVEKNYQAMKKRQEAEAKKNK